MEHPALKYLGFKAVDRVTGAKGIICQYAETLYGCPRVALYGQIDASGKVPEATEHDVDDVKLVSKKPHLHVGEIIVADRIELGMEVQDTLTEAHGVTTRRYVMLNGCVYYTVVAPKLSDQGQILEHWLPQQRLAPIKKRGSNVQRAKPLDSPVAGGPITKAMKY